jgi:hypothetical protein
VRENYPHRRPTAAASRRACSTIATCSAGSPRRSLATWNGTGWVKGDSQDTAYNSSARSPSAESTACGRSNSPMTAPAGSGGPIPATACGATSSTTAPATRPWRSRARGPTSPTSASTRPRSRHRQRRLLCRRRLYRRHQRHDHVFDKRGHRSSRPALPKRQLNATAAASGPCRQPHLQRVRRGRHRDRCSRLHHRLRLQHDGPADQKLSPTVNYTTESGAVSKRAADRILLLRPRRPDDRLPRRQRQPHHPRPARRHRP